MIQIMIKLKKHNQIVRVLLILLISLSLTGVFTACSDEDSPFFFEKKGEEDGDWKDIKPEIVEETTEPQPVKTKEPEKPIEPTQTPDLPADSPEPTASQEPEGANEQDNFDANMDTALLSNETYSWSFKRNTTHEPTTGYAEGINLKNYGTYYRVETEEKVVYLTFDEGYENGLTPTLLDVLLENDVKATFFVTKPFITQNPDLCLRMVEEGHIVGNHSVTHPSFPDLTNDEIAYELSGTNEAFLEATGESLAMFFRPPMGKFSERALAETRKNGFKTIFWSLAYGDWDAQNQPGVEAGYQHMMENYHPGAIFLLHAVSESSVGALPQVIQDLKAEGYRFGSLYELD